MVTSITIQPISGLDLPTVTICPLEGLNTALYHDLTKHDNNSLNHQDRENLKMAAYKIFMEESYAENAEEMIALTNPDNLEDVLRGFQSYPRPYSWKIENPRLLATTSELGKTLQTPGFGGKV